MRKSKHPAAAKTMAKNFASGKAAFRKATPLLKKYITASSNAQAFAKKTIKIWPKIFKASEKLNVAMGAVVVEIETAEAEMEEAEDYSNVSRVKELEKVVAKLEFKYGALDDKFLDVSMSLGGVSGPMYEFAGTSAKLASAYTKIIQKTC